VSARVVSLMGIDGSGKSTISRALQEELQRRGVPSVARWATLRPFLLRPAILAAKYLLVRKAPKSVDYEAHVAAKRSGMSKLRFAHGLYFALMTLDYLPQAWWKVGLPRLLGKTVICDRYVHDLALDYAITVDGGPECMLRALRRLQPLVPSADLLYFVHVRPDVAMARKDDVPSVAYLEERDRYYRALREALALPQLDGEAAVSANCERLLTDLQTCASPA
jgi:thymidylate kinase